MANSAAMDEDLGAVLTGVGSRLRALRRQHDITLTALAETTGISVSTLSRLESGQRRPTLELLLPLARTYGVPLDDLVGGPVTGDPRVHLRPVRRHGMTVVPLTIRPGGIQAYKLIIPVRRSEPEAQAHEGYEWLYVLDGRLRVVLGDRDLVLRPGEAAEFDTRVPHWFGSAGDGPVEVLSLFGPQGERAHLRARPRQAAPVLAGPSPVGWDTVPENHPLRLYNSLGRRLEDFVPAGPVVGMYSCGPTVYAFPHLGNMRPYVFADTLRRAFRWRGIGVRHVLNITDVGHAVADTNTGEDKIEVAAAREMRSVMDIAAFYTDVFFVDTAALNILPADEYPRATAYVEQMIEFAKKLEKDGYTYQLPSGLYFDTAKDPHYGELALMNTEGQLEAARLEYVEGRRRKTDFALWRAEEPGQRRVLRWDSPWGWGAPGWHLECSVMSMALLGQHFDLHTGGVDHRQLHHVNEIAQSQAFLGDGRPWVRYWLHNEFLQLGAEKMAKSAGGAPRLADLTEAGYHPMAYRLFLLGGHYRSQLGFTTAAVDAAQATLRRLVARVQPLRPLPAVETLTQATAGVEGDPAAQRLLDTMDAAIAADLNTSRILAALQDALREPAITPDGLRTVVAAADALLGLGLATLEPADLEQRRAVGELSAEDRRAIEELVADRTQARKERDWARADQIRAQLEELGVEITDTPDGPVWQLR